MPSDGHFASAGVHFKKDRQKYRQPVGLLKVQHCWAAVNLYIIQLVMKSDGGTADVLSIIS
jgi:hypothetical protein